MTQESVEEGKKVSKKLYIYISLYIYIYNIIYYIYIFRWCNVAASKQMRLEALGHPGHHQRPCARQPSSPVVFFARCVKGERYAAHQNTI